MGYVFQVPLANLLFAHLDAIRSGTAPLGYEISSWKDLETWFLAQIELQKNFAMTRGCPFGTIGNEITENDELIRQDLNLIFDVMKKTKSLPSSFAKNPRAILPRQPIRSALQISAFAAIQGAMLMGKINRNSRPVETAAREALAHLRGYVLNPKNNR